MTFYDRLAGLHAALGAALLMVGLAAVPQDAMGSLTPITLALCASTCSPGNAGTSPPCQTSGACTVASGAPANTTCSGCNFGVTKDSSGTIIGCTSSCNGSSGPIGEES